jgi:hypothetical protein
VGEYWDAFAIAFFMPARLPGDAGRLHQISAPGMKNSTSADHVRSTMKRSAALQNC